MTPNAQTPSGTTGAEPSSEGSEPPADDERVEGPVYGETWTYEGLIGAIPGVSITPWAAVALQVVGFEVAVLGLAWYYGLWDAVVSGTIAVLVAGGGSAITLRMGARLRALALPAAYRRLAFGSRVEIVLSVLAYVGLVTYLLAAEPVGTETSLLESALGPDPPLLATYLALLLAWDVVYRIGIGWWASVAAVWRSWRYEFDPGTARAVARVDRWPLAFAALQLALLPIVWGRPLLVGALLGHVLAVSVAVGLSVGLLRR
ncbi:hypothetical protein GCM10028857_25550 [Salinarchaeum chitinilyticum]